MEQPVNESLAFDRAVAYYDRTRRLSDATMSRLVEMLGSQLRTPGLCLEIGVGTGRIALPLAASGIELVGVDLSAPMLRELVRKSDKRAPVGVVVGDAVALPFKDTAFGSVLIIHVLHLIPRWTRAIDEMWRVVRPGGRIVVEIGGKSSGANREIRRYFSPRAGLSGRDRGLRDPGALDEVMTARGARRTLLDPIVERGKTTYEKTIKALEDGLFSFTWDASEDARTEAARQTRRWAHRRWGDLDRPYEYEHQIQYRVYDLP